MARRVEIDLVGDTSAFEKSMGNAAKSVDKLESELKDTAGSASKFDSAMDKTNGHLGTATDKFRSTSDLAGGLGDVLGISAIGPIAGYATGMADIADGLGGLLAPALAKSKAAFLSMNATLMANPIFLVVAVLAALAIAFVVAYKKSETFRNIVNGALSAVTDGVKKFGKIVEDVTVKAAHTLAKIADIITTPYQLAFKAIAWAWNNTVGKLSFSIPGWVPGLGGKGFDVPDIPTFATGGITNGPTLAMVGDNPGGREAIVPLSGPNAGGLSQRLEIHLSGDRELVEMMRRSIRTRGGNVQVVLGSA